MKKLIVIAFLATSLSAFAQTGTFRGFVYDKTDESPIPFANIAIKDVYKGTASNLLGEFSFKGKSSERNYVVPR